MKNKTGAFGNSKTRKDSFKVIESAFYNRVSAVRGQRKKPNRKNVVEFLERKGYASRHLKALEGRLS